MSSRRGGGLRVNLGEEIVGNGAGTVNVGERFPDDTSGKLGGQPEDVLAQLGLGDDPIRRELHGGCGDELLTHPMPLRANISEEHHAFLVRSLTDLRGFVPGGTQLSLVLGMNALRLPLGFRGPLQRALGGTLTLGEGPLDPGQQHLGYEGEDGSEANRGDYEIREMRFQGSHGLTVVAPTREYRRLDGLKCTMRPAD